MAIMGWGEIFKGSLLAASYVLKHEATRFHQKPASYGSNSNTPTSHYWPTSCPAVLGLSKGAPSFKTFSNPQANLTRVPAELKLGILRSISEVKTLRALAIASKDYHAVFEENPKSILSSILATEINPEVFPVALAATKSSTLRWTQESHFKKVNEFLGAFCEEDPDTITPSVVPVRLLMRTSRLHNDVSYLAEDFLRSRMKNLALMAPKSGDNKLPLDPPSTHELKRIHRGFHLLEMFTNLFRNPQPSSYTYGNARHITSDDIASSFLGMVPAYQIEEMVCARDYIFDKLSEVFVDVQQELSTNPVTYVKYRAGQPLPNLPPGFELEPEFHPGAAWMDRGCAGYLDLSPDSIAYDGLKETRLMKGLSYLCRLFKASTGLQRKHILEELAFDIHNSNTLYYALKATPHELLYEEEAYEAFYHQDEDCFESKEKGLNAGWAWANNNKMELRYGQWITEELRDWGYVMWDKSRLEKMGILALDSPQWRHERDGFKNTSVEDHPYHSHHLQHCLRGDELNANNEEAETNTDTMEGLESPAESTTNVESPIQISEEVLEELPSMEGDDESVSDGEFEEEMENDVSMASNDFVEEDEIGTPDDQPASDEVSEEQEMEDDRSEISEDENDWVESLPSRTHVKSPIKVAKGTLTDFPLSDVHDIDLDDLPQEKAAGSTEDCLDTIAANEVAASDNKNHVKLNPEDEELLRDMQKDLKDEATANAPHIKLSQAATKAYYSDPEDFSTSKDPTIITPELANEVDEVPVLNPTSDHADFAVDLDAASESTTFEGPAIITAVDLDVDSKNKPSSEEPASRTVDQVVDHPVASSFAFGSGSLESQLSSLKGQRKSLTTARLPLSFSNPT